MNHSVLRYALLFASSLALALLASGEQVVTGPPPEIRGHTQPPSKSVWVERALSINDADDVVGVDSTADGLERAFLWRHGMMTNLGTIGTDPGSEALSINSQGQVVGDTRDPIADVFLRAFLWEHGGPMVDLNTLVPRNSSLQLIKAIYVNDRGEIAVRGVLSNGNLHKLHAVLLIPCDDNHAGVEGCDYDLVDAATAATQSAARPHVPSTTQRLPQSRWNSRYHIRGLRIVRQIVRPGWVLGLSQQKTIVE